MSVFQIKRVMRYKKFHIFWLHAETKNMLSFADRQTYLEPVDFASLSSSMV